jgi:ribosomal RNA-processing protein 8
LEEKLEAEIFLGSNPSGVCPFAYALVLLLTNSELPGDGVPGLLLRLRPADLTKNLSAGFVSNFHLIPLPASGLAMFAVPGWAVSASSLVQEQRSSSTTSDRPSLGSATSASNKRKLARAHTDRVSKVSGSELDRLWNQQNTLKRTGKAEDQSRLKHAPKEDRPVKKAKDETTKKEPSRPDNGSSTDRSAGQELKAKARGKKHRPTDADSTQERRETRIEKPRRNEAHSTKASGASPAQILEKLPPAAPQNTKLTPLQAKMRNKLTSARFRHLNETLYTTTSSSAMDLFTTSPDLFAEYHAGFSQQVKDSWPQNPVDQYIKNIKTRGTVAPPSANKTTPLPRRKTGSCTIADLGCGDAPLARGCQSVIKSLTLKFHNFDLHTPNSHVTKADISNLPLRDGEADIVVFCLSLMGTNWVSFVEEAWRILRGDGKGEVWVAEVKSRFGRVSRAAGGGPMVVENSVGKRRKNQNPRKPSGNDVDDGLPAETLLADEDTTTGSQRQDDTDISAFVKVFARRGFQLREDSVDKTNKMFVSMIFVKSGIPTAGKHKGLKWNGHEYQRQQQSQEGKTRFAGGQARRGAEEDDVSPLEEAKVLKPCVYKTR